MVYSRAWTDSISSARKCVHLETLRLHVPRRFLFVTWGLLHKVTALFIIVLILGKGKKAEFLNVQIEHVRCQTIVDRHSCYVQPVCIGDWVIGVPGLSIRSRFANALFCVWVSGSSIANVTRLIVWPTGAGQFNTALTERNSSNDFAWNSFSHSAPNTNYFSRFKHLNQGKSNKLSHRLLFFVYKVITFGQKPYYGTGRKFLMDNYRLCG